MFASVPVAFAGAGGNQTPGKACEHGSNNPKCMISNVPEIGAEGALAALGLLGAMLLLVADRRRPSI